MIMLPVVLATSRVGNTLGGVTTPEDLRDLDAVATLADAAPLPVELRHAAEGRYPAAVETCAYFLVAEALDDAAGRDASHATVSVARDGGRLVVTVEDGGRAGGVGATLTQALQDRGADVPLRALGLPQAFLEHGSVGQVLADVGLTEQDVARRIAEWTAVLAERSEGSVAEAVEERP